MLPGLWIGLLFGAAGRLDWWRGWVSVVLYLGSVVAVLTIVRRKNPGLLEARSKFRSGDARRFDVVFFALFLPLATLHPAVAGFDAVRFRWTAMPASAAAAGALVFGFGAALIVWSMSSNPFAETIVRIQNDRGHKVVTRGPYSYVRHPMYVGIVGTELGLPLVWGSWWALAVGVAMSVLLVARTALEDRTLRQELGGYEDYATGTRYRLLPGVW